MAEMNMCCFIPCENEAEWEIIDTEDLTHDNYTHSCSKHLRKLTRHTDDVYRIDVCDDVPSVPMNDETLMIALRIAAEEVVFLSNWLASSQEELDSWIDDTVECWIREARNE